MLLFDENGIGRLRETIRERHSMPDRPATCEPTEHPVHAEFSGCNSVRDFGIAISRR
jgi:hypothetical protein